MALVRTTMAAALIVCASTVGAGASWADVPRPSPLNANQPGQESRGRLGIVPLSISAELRAALGAPKERGVLVDQVLTGSPAAKAGVRVGDVIAEVDGKPVESRDDVVQAIAGKKTGDTVVMRVIRDRQSLVIAAKLEADAAPSMSGPGPGWMPIDPSDGWQGHTEDLPGGGKLWSFRWQGNGDDPMPPGFFSFPFGNDASKSTEKRIDELERKIEALEKRLDASKAH